METLIPKIMELGGTAVVAIVALLGYQKLFRKNGYEKKSYNEIKLIGENHLNGILEAIREGNKSNNDWHERQYNVLLDILKK